MIDVRESIDVLSPYRPRKMAVGDDYNMRINQDWLRCVTFICVDRKKDLEERRFPIATAFWIRFIDEEDESIPWKYIVTARHIIEDRSEDDINDKLHIRFNLIGGGYEDYTTDRSDWLTHNGADVALIEINLPIETLKRINHLAIPLSMFIDKDYAYRSIPFVKDKSIVVWPHLGDEVYFIGLFTQHTGRKQNLPIVRFGNISAMPIEPVTLPRWNRTAEFEQIVWLVECKSWGGHSGSPAFWTMPVPFLEKKGGKEIWTTRNMNAFLGLVSAHFDVAKELKTSGEYSYLGKIEAGINAGIACVTPAEAIRQLLMEDDLILRRQESRKSISKGPRATLDIGQIGEQFMTKEQFINDLKKVSQKKSDSK